MSQTPDAFTPESLQFVPPTVEQLGEMLPHYEVQGLIASGGMGAVYKARQQDLDRMVAIKILPPEAGNDAESLNRFRSEARAMAKLNHPNIVSIYDFGAKEGQCYFVMEYVEGRNVHELIVEGVVTPELANAILSQVCDALTFAHSKGIIHGDIKPSNVVVDAEGQVKLLDFGLARLMEQEQTDADADWVPMGTPEYAAPELYERGAVADPRTDIYALGVVYYEMLMRSVPQGTFALPSTALTVDGRVDDIIVRCLRPEPDNRFQNAAEVRQLLDDIRTGKPLVPVGPDLNPRSPRPVTIVRPSARRGTPPSPTGVRGASRPGESRQSQLEAAKQKKSHVPIILGAVVLLLGAVAALMNSGKPPENSEAKPAPPPDKSVKPEEISFAPPKPPEATNPDKTLKPMSNQGGDGELDAPVVKDTSKPVEPNPKLVPTGPSVLAKLREDFIKRYRDEIHSKILTQQKDLGDKYCAALDRLEPELMARNDAKAVLEIRQETERFKSKLTAPQASQLSKNPKVADLQKKLITAFEGFRKSSAPAITKLNGEFAVATAKLADMLKSQNNPGESTSALEDSTKAAKLPDYLGILAGVIEGESESTEDPSTKPGGDNREATVAEGNLAQSGFGATAEAPRNAGGMIDGSQERETAATGSEADTFTVTLDQVYKIAQIRIHLTRGEDGEHRYNYVVQGSADGKSWKTLADYSKNAVPGIAIINITPQAIRAFRIQGRKSTNDGQFVIDEVGAWCDGSQPSEWGD